MLILFLSFFSGLNLASDFPCPLETIRKSEELPAIVISGEDHDCPLCIADQEHRTKMAAEGRYHYGLEGALYNHFPESDSVFGLEEYFPYQVSAIIVAYENVLRPVRDNPASVDVEMGEFFEEFGRSPLFQTTWMNARREIIESFENGGQLLVELLDLLAENKSVWQPGEYPKWVKNQKSRITSIRFLQFLQIFSKKYLEILRLNAVPNLILPPSIELMKDLRSNLDAASETLVIRWRNEIMAKHIAIRYCRNFQLLSPPRLVITVGEAHVAHLKEVLEANSKRLVPIKIKKAEQSTLKRNAKLEARKQNAKKARVEIQVPLNLAPFFPEQPFWDFNQIPSLGFDHLEL